MIGRVGSQASERRTERSDGLNPLGLRSGRSRKSRSLRRAGRVIPPNPTRPARSHLWLPKLSRMHTYNTHASAIFKNKNMVGPGQLFLPSPHDGELKKVSSMVYFAAKQPFNVMRYVSRICHRMSLTLCCRKSSGQTLRHCELSSSLSIYL